MDLFRFTNPANPTQLRNGELIQDTDSKMWVERYRDPGEFEVIAKISTDIRSKLPIGSFVSHVDTTEVMVVENHELTDNGEDEPAVKVTGRSFETYLEQRIVGSDQSWPAAGPPADYILVADHPAVQVYHMIRRHILPSLLIDDDLEIPFLEPKIVGVTSGSAPGDRQVKRGDLYSKSVEILKVDDLGLKSVRPGPWSPATDKSWITLVIHKGVDRSTKVTFSHHSGELVSGDYLWSNKKVKNCALVSGRWVETLVDSPAAKINRRMMFVDASDIDQAQETNPVGVPRTWIVAAMQQRGREALAAQKEVALVKAEVSQQALSAIFRQDYDVGDLVKVVGNYGESSKMRVTEYVEIEDENGRRGYPTLSLPEEET